MDVEDNAAGEEGVDHTGQSTVPLMGYQLQVPWDDLQRNDRSEVSLRQNTGRIKKIGVASNKVNVRTDDVSTMMMFAKDRTRAVSG